MKSIPEINKTYNYFDDGKIRESRRIPVLITKIIPFNEADSQTVSHWEEEASCCDWLYRKTTDYFIFGDLKLSENIEKIIFVRTVDNGWFSLDWWAGRLDIDGSLNKLLLQNDNNN